jgi:mercuric ion binding protein
MTTSHQMKLKLMLLLALTGLAWNSPAADKPKVTANATNHFTITGMHCDGCAGGLKSELKETPGVASAEVTFSNKLAVVTFDTNKVTTVKLTKVIKDAGFAAKEVKP